MKIEYHPSTVSDLNRAVTYYESLRPGLGRECRSEIYKAIGRIREAPRRYRTVDQDVAFIQRPQQAKPACWECSPQCLPATGFASGRGITG